MHPTCRIVPPEATEKSTENERVLASSTSSNLNNARDTLSSNPVQSVTPLTNSDTSNLDVNTSNVPVPEKKLNRRFLYATDPDPQVVERISVRY